MFDRYMRAHVRVHSRAPEKIRELAEEELVDMFLQLPPPAIAFDAWVQPYLAPAKAAEANQKAELDRALSDPVLVGLGMKVVEK